MGLSSHTSSTSWSVTVTQTGVVMISSSISHLQIKFSSSKIFKWRIGHIIRCIRVFLGSNTAIIPLKNVCKFMYDEAKPEIQIKILSLRYYKCRRHTRIVALRFNSRKVPIFDQATFYPHLIPERTWSLRSRLTCP